METLEYRGALAKALHDWRTRPDSGTWNALNDLARAAQQQADDVLIAGDDLLAKTAALPETEDLRDWNQALRDALESAPPDQAKVADLIGETWLLRPAKRGYPRATRHPGRRTGRQPGPSM